MKNLIYLFVLGLTIMSCEDEGTSTENQEPIDDVLLTRQVYNYNSGQFVDEINYEGNRITSITSNGELIGEFSYSNDLLIEYTAYVNGDTLSSFSFEYDENNNLDRYVADLPFLESTYEAEFQFNNDDTIDVEYSYDGESNFEGAYTLFLENRNIVKYVSEVETITYTYDSMKNSMANVYAADILVLIPGDFGGTDFYGVTNNTISVLYEVNGDPDQNESETYVYEYNEQGFPTVAEIFYDGDSDGTIEYYYN